MPSEEWKLKNYRQKWFAGETISVGIGQGAIATTPVQLMRAVSAISMGGHMVRPHVVFPDKVPETYRNALHYTDTQDIAIDPTGWQTITDAMGEVLLPEGTAPSAHIAGVDIAGKTGSAQTVSNAMKAKMSNKQAFAYKDNGWFVGFTPRRNPDIIVCVLFEGGEHGKLAARLATQVIKAYDDKKNHRPLKHLVPPTDDTTPQESRPEAAKPTEVTGLWSDGGSDSGHLQAARFRAQDAPHPFHRAVAAPGMEQFAQTAPSPSGPPQPRKHSWQQFPPVVAALPEPLWRAGELR
jgi:penicillin-binding protein 2